MEKISTTNPAKITIGAMVIRLVLYTSSALNTLGSLLLPPAINIKPSIIIPIPPSIHTKLVLSNKGTRLDGVSFVAVVAFFDFIIAVS